MDDQFSPFENSQDRLSPFDMIKELDKMNRIVRSNRPQLFKLIYHKIASNMPYHNMIEPKPPTDNKKVSYENEAFLETNNDNLISLKSIFLPAMFWDRVSSFFNAQI